MANAHTFNVSLAAEVGLNQAILLQHLYYWHQINHKKKHNIKDGKVWTYNTVDEFAEIFPYLTSRQISYAFNSLEKAGFIETGNYNKASFDRTKWYTLTEKSLELFVNSNLQNVRSIKHNVKSNVQNVESNIQNVDTIPDNNTDSNTDNNTNTIIDVPSDDDIKGKIFFKIVEFYPKNRIGNRQHGLRKFKQLDIDQAKLAARNLNRYLKIAGQYVKSLQNYIDQECYSEAWLSAEEKTKQKQNSITDNKTKIFSGNYDDLD